MKSLEHRMRISQAKRHRPITLANTSTGKRQCGDCSLCCKIMDAGPIKPRHDWCQHATVGKGCAIYRTRPEVCRQFACMWLIDNRIPDYWFPAKSKIVINTSVEGIISFCVDPDYPVRWLEEPYISDIKYIAKAGIEGRLGKKWATVVLVKDKKIPIIGTERLFRQAG